MGKVSKAIENLVTKQIQDHGIVVWYDPEQVYTDLVSRLELPKTTILKFDGSFFELRYRMEPLLEFVDEKENLCTDTGIPPRLLVYVPMDRASTHYALIEAEAAGVIMQPGATPWQRNTRLKVLAERVFKKIAPERARSIAKDVEDGRMTLKELDWLAEQTGGIGKLKLIFGTTSSIDIILKFLSSDRFDKQIVEKDAIHELANLIRTDFGIEIKSSDSVEQVREEFYRALLLFEVVIKAGYEETPEKLSSVQLPEKERQREQILDLCHKWRNRLDLCESYIEAAQKTQAVIQLSDLGLEPQQLMNMETFPLIEAILVSWAEEKLLEGKDLQAVSDLARERKSSFWALREPDFQLRWNLLKLAASVLLIASSIEEELKNLDDDVDDIIKAYTEGVKSDGGMKSLPWYMLDRYQRHLEHRYAMLDFQVEGDHDQLEKVIAYVRNRYVEVVTKCTEKFVRAFEKAKLKQTTLINQREIFSKKVHPLIGEVKTAYFLVDALRYEMGLELIEGLEDERFDVEATAAFAQLPTITEVGMASLVAGANTRLELVETGKSGVGIKAGDSILKDRSTRVKYFANLMHNENILVLKLNELMKPSKKRREDIAQADVILVTSQEIDRLGEEVEDEEEARRFMDEVLGKLRRAIRKLGDLGVEKIVISADHGYLFVDEIEEGLKIDPPGGNTADLRSRVWIGKGGARAPGSLRINSDQIRLAGDLELVFPVGLGCYRKRGPYRGYFHGGISLQEALVPVITITVLKKTELASAVEASVQLKLAKPKITTRFFSIEVRYVVGGLFDFMGVAKQDTKRVKVVVRAGRQNVGKAAMAAYGFEEGRSEAEIVLERDKPNAITMMLTEEFESPVVSVHVLDALTDVELASLKNIPVEISI